MFRKFIQNNYIYSALVPASVSWICTALSIFILEDYGWGVFILVPLFIGICSTVLYGLVSKTRFRTSLSVAASSLCIYCIGLILFAMEGAICILMAAPLGFLITLIGVAIGEVILRYKKGSSLHIVLHAV